MLRPASSALPASGNPDTSSSSALSQQTADPDTHLAGATSIPPGADFQARLNHVVKLAQILTRANWSAIALRGDNGAVCQATWGEGAPAIGTPVNVSSGISKQCWETGTALRCDDLASDSRVDRAGSRAIGMRSMAVVPVYCAGEIGGILAVFAGTTGAFHDRHLDKLQWLADLIEPRPTERNHATAVPENLPVPEKLNAQAPRKLDLTFLVERDPAYRTFWSSLVELFERRTPPASMVSGDSHAWDHVFVESKISWKPFVESIALHFLIIGMMFGLSKLAPRQPLMFSNPLRDARITYYPPTYSARASRPPQEKIRRALARNVMTSGAKHPLVVASGAQSGGGGSRPQEIAAPQLQASDLQRWQQLKLGGGNPALPAPPTNGLRGRLPGVPIASVVEPSPEVGGAPGLRAFSVAGAPVVPPSPSVGGSIGRTAGRTSQAGAPGTGSIAIVPPPPVMSEHPGLSHGMAGEAFRPGAQIIAPPPSIEGEGGFGTRGQGIASTGGGGSGIVPPPPSIDGKAGSGGGTRMGSLAGGAQVVPPSPSIGGNGGIGNGGLGTRGRSLAIAGNGSGIVPPSPSVQAEGGFGGRGRTPGLGGGGVDVVPPPPSVLGSGGTGGGSGGSGRGTSLAGGGVEVVPPAPGTGGEGDGSGGGTSLGKGRGGAMAGLGTGNVLPPATGSGGGAGGGGGAPNVPASASRVGSNSSRPGFQDVQLKVVSLAMSLPNSSYFSNYEVFVAERWLSKSESQLVKLVYVFLPYQHRLSEYGDLTKVFKVRVTRDPTCDESLMQIMWPEGGSPAAGSESGSQPSADHANRKDLLPCYRTTADDYRRALSGKRR